MENLKHYLDTNKERFLDELVALLKIPSVSADPEYKGDVLEAADFLEAKLREAGLSRTEQFSTPGYPIVFAEHVVDPAMPTVLVYGHYDVQPPDPLELWESPPFEPVIKDERIYARGASDDKGQAYMHVKALEMMIRNDALPCNVKVMLEGEEEVGSEHLEHFVQEHKDLLKADVLIVSDSSMVGNDTPSITTGLRGLSYLEVEVTGPNRDLHSGVYGGAVANPINVLCSMISSLHDENGRITVAGFYGDVLDVESEERQAMAKVPFNLETYKGDLEVDEVRGESGFSTLERTMIRPTLDVNGIWGGYTGEGAKTVLPSKAYAKISMRLVPNQNSAVITEQFAKHFLDIAPPYVRVQITPMHGGEPAITPTDSIAFKAASLAMEETFGKAPIPIRNGGSIPIVEMFERLLNVKTVLMGFGLDSDAIHSPNEHFGLFNYFKGIETLPYFYRYYAELSSQNGH